MLFLLNLLARLPDSILYALARVLAWVLFYVVRYRRETVQKNIGLAFSEKTSSERLVIEKNFYRHISSVTMEIIMLSRMSREQLLQRVELSGLDCVNDYVKKGQSVILLSAHQGNWEWMLAAVASVIHCPLDALYRPLHNQAMDRFFMDMRTRFGSHLIPAQQAARAILKLRKEARAFGILGDQNPRRKDDKYWTTFMGTETPVASGPERIAKLTEYPLFYVSMERSSRGKYRCVIEPLVEAPYNGEGEISKIYMGAVERGIRRQPECWMWSHHRWRYAKSDCLV